MFRMSKKAMALVALCAVFLTACVIFGGCSNTASGISGGVSSGGGSGTPSQCKHENVVTLDAEDATCTDTGLTEGKKCSDCDVVIVERTTVDMKAHTWGEWTQTIAPTEDDDGQEKATCSVCNTEGTRPIPALGHTHKYSGTWAHDDTHHWHPTTCNHDDVENALNKTTHGWGTGTETKAPTCVAKGEKTYTCTTCGKTKTEDIAATGIHTEVELPTVEATCTVTGLTAGKKCSVCDVVTVAQTTVEKKPHTEVAISAVEATCTKTGKTAGKKCSVCGEVTVAQTTVEKKPHTEVTIPAVPATITATGLTEGKKCSVCNQIPVAQTEIPMLPATTKNVVDAIEALPSGGSITIVLDSSETTISADLENVLKDPNKKVTLDLSASGVTSIGSWAFYGCSSLTSVKIPSKVTSINDMVFYGCSSLTSVEIPSSVTSIGKCAFMDCSSLTSVKIPSSVKSIGDQTFMDCSSLTSVEIPSSVKSIGHSVFKNCSSLTSVKIPDGVTRSIDSDAFYGCSSLESIEIPDGVTSIGSYAFYGCKLLESIEIPDGVTSIGEYAFRGCKSLTSVEIPSSVTSIGGEMFAGCTSLTTIKYAGSKYECNLLINRNLYTLNAYSFPANGVTCNDGKTYKFDGRKLGDEITE